MNEQTLTRMMVNPMYATARCNPALLDVEPAMGPDEWVELQAGVIEGIEQDGEAVKGAGIDSWLHTLLACLEGQLPADHPVSPAHAVSVDPILCEEHPRLVEPAEWKAVQEQLAEEHGLYSWLDEMLQAIG